jgi:propanol-preferring alcohol dehydrogenase
MQAAVFQVGGSIAVREVPVPERKPGGVLLRVRACGICGRDLHVLQGGWPMRPH